MKSRIFVDSNIWVYLFSNENDNRCKQAEQFILESGSNNILVISYQVMNEVTNVLNRKKFTESIIRNVIEHMTKICTIQDYSKDIALLASRLREEHSFSFWDSHIVSCAVMAQCDLLVSEDMQDKQIIKGMKIRNIFK